MGGRDEKPKVRDGEASVVRGDGIGGVVNPVEEFGVGNGELAIFDVDVDARRTNLNGGGQFILLRPEQVAGAGKEHCEADDHDTRGGN